MQVWKYSSMQVCRYASMQVCKYASMQVCKYAGMQCRYVGMQYACHFLSYTSNRKKIFYKSYIQYFYNDDCYLLHAIAICDSLSVTCNLLPGIRLFFSESCYYLQKLVTFARCSTSHNFDLVSESRFLRKPANLVCRKIWRKSRKIWQNFMCSLFWIRKHFSSD